jgi:hypothetical protein
MTAHCPSCHHVTMHEDIVGGRRSTQARCTKWYRQFPHAKTCPDYEREPGSDDERIDPARFDERQRCDAASRPVGRIVFKVCRRPGARRILLGRAIAIKVSVRVTGGRRGGIGIG